MLRLDSAYRTSLDDVSNLYVPIKGGYQIPLSQVATVSFKSGPAQISREAGKRRIYISFNVSGRDVSSVVKELRQRLTLEKTSSLLPPTSKKHTSMSSESYTTSQLTLDALTILFCSFLILSTFVNLLTQRIKDIETERSRAATKGSSTNSRKNIPLLWCLH